MQEVTKDYVDKLSKNKISAESLNNFCVYALWDKDEIVYVGLYALWDKDEIVYVGKSTQLGQRLTAHTKNKLFDSYSFIDCKSFDEMDSIESTLIIQLQPKYNVQYGNGYESLAKLRKRISEISDKHKYNSKISDKHKYNPKYYVRKIRKCLSETDIEMIEFKGSTVIKTEDVPKALKYVLEGD